MFMTNTDTATATKSNVREKVSRLLEGLSAGIYEKDEAIRLAFLCALAGESIFLLGPPGVAKSLIARRLKFAFADGKSFEYLMSRFSTPDEVFGPVSIKKLKDEDRYERLTDKYLPGANVVFLDEIWKAGPAIQNALLTVINEKVYRNGEQEIQTDIKCIVSASNELPKAGEGLDALWDRFLVRYTISEIKQKGNFLKMLVNVGDVYDDTVPANDKLSHGELEAWSSLIDQVEMPAEVLNTIQLVKHRLENSNGTTEGGFKVFDRRWKKCVRLLRTAAFLNGRGQVDLMDCFLLAHCLWDTPAQTDPLREILAETVRKHGYSVAVNLRAVKAETAAFEEEVETETSIPTTAEGDELFLVEKKYYEILNIAKHFEGRYIKSEEFERLGIDDYATLGLYNDTFTLTYKIKARKTQDEHQLDVYHNSKAELFGLRTLRAEKKVYVPKKPHPVVLKYWEDKAEKLRAYLEAAKEKLDAEAPELRFKLENNFFVDKALAALPLANLNETINETNALLLRIEKLQHFYRNL